MKWGSVICPTSETLPTAEKLRRNKSNEPKKKKKTPRAVAAIIIAVPLSPRRLLTQKWHAYRTYQYRSFIYGELRFITNAHTPGRTKLSYLLQLDRQKTKGSLSKPMKFETHINICSVA